MYNMYQNYKRYRLRTDPEDFQPRSVLHGVSANKENEPSISLDYDNGEFPRLSNNIFSTPLGRNLLNIINKHADNLRSLGLFQTHNYDSPLKIEQNPPHVTTNVNELNNSLNKVSEWKDKNPYDSMLHIINNPENVEEHLDKEIGKYFGHHLIENMKNFHNYGKNLLIHDMIEDDPIIDKDQIYSRLKDYFKNKYDHFLELQKTNPDIKIEDVLNHTGQDEELGSTILDYARHLKV